MTTDRLEGVLPVDKPAGPTSHDVVLAARRALRVRRIGHTGTLDPFASGLLLLLLGRATRLAEYFDDLPKSYSATARLGLETDTEDLTGRPLRESEAWRDLDLERVRIAFESMVGERLQRPPAFSAKKVGGQRAYDVARGGETVILDPVPVRIHALRVTSIELPLVRFETTCSTGTYVRSLARDAGDALGVHAHLVQLRRTAIGPFDVAGAVPAQAVDLEAASGALLAPWESLAHRARVTVGPEAASRLANGLTVSVPEGGPTADEGEMLGVAVGCQGQLVAMADIRGGRIQPRKVFHG